MTPKPIIHGYDHLPGGADPIPVASGSALLLWANTITGSDAGTITVPAYAGGHIGGAVNGLPYEHALEPTDTSWYTLNYLGSPAASPPYDDVDLVAGDYHVWAWAFFVDSGNAANLGFQVTSTTTDPTSFPYSVMTASRFVDDSGTYADYSDPLHPRWSGQFFVDGPSYVQPGESATVFTTVFHVGAHTISVDANWWLRIVQLA